MHAKTKLKDEHLIKRFKRTVDGILFEAFPYLRAFFFGTACCSIHPACQCVNKRLAAHVSFLDTACTSIVNVEASNCKINK